MTTTARALPDLSRQGANANLAAGSDSLHDVVALAYELGRDSVRQVLLERADDMWNARPWPKPRRTFEQRVADRLAEMEARFGPPRYMGGPVEWEPRLPSCGRLEQVIA